ALLTRAKATVIRDGAEMEIDPAGIVAGDVLRVRPGDQVLADGTVLAGRTQIDESLLTGESDPIEKAVGDEVHAGTFCVSGEGYVEAVKVGSASTAGGIAAGAKAAR